MEEKKYEKGMYGGKFMPFHKGHFYCIEKAMEECKRLYVLLFYGGDDELEILKNTDDETLDYRKRFEIIKRVCDKRYGDDVVVKLIDVTKCKKENGEEDWDAETPLVLKAMGKMDAVYSSEISYGDYFSRAYPWAKHVLVDPPRIVYPISGTKIRNMKNEEEKNLWRM